MLGAEQLTRNPTLLLWLSGGLLLRLRERQFLGWLGHRAATLVGLPHRNHTGCSLAYAGFCFEILSKVTMAFENLLLAARLAQKGKRFRGNVLAFNHDLEQELFRLQTELTTRRSLYQAASEGRRNTQLSGRMMKKSGSRYAGKER